MWSSAPLAQLGGFWSCIQYPGLMWNGQDIFCTDDFRLDFGVTTRMVMKAGMICYVLISSNYDTTVEIA